MKKEQNLENSKEQALTIPVARRSFTVEDMKKAFDAGGDWRIACKNLTDGIYTKEQWANTNDFEEFIEENYA